jgi:RHS repeat-associated protein
MENGGPGQFHNDPAGSRPLSPTASAPPTSSSFAVSGNAPTSPRSLDLLPSVTLPRGGGAIRGIGEKFTVNPSTGTGGLAIPVAVSPGRSSLMPELNLTYDSGAGNGPFGFGWNLPLPSVTRKTDKGLPRYRSADESDVFLFSGAEDLVPVLNAGGSRVAVTRTILGITYEIASYRPRIEGLFNRIERWTELLTGMTHWRSISKDNVTALYGFTADSRIADPDDPTRIFSYLMCRTWDDKGNLATFSYVAEDSRGVELSGAHEANRDDPIRGTQRYLKAIQYGNAEPYFPTWTADGAEPPLTANWHFKLLLDYGDHSANTPTLNPDQSWPVRPDPFSSYRSGFELRTYRRVQRFLMFHNFPGEEVGADCLVRSIDLTYSDQQEPADPNNPIYSLLVSIGQTGFLRSGGTYVSEHLPPLELEYSKPTIRPDVLMFDSESQNNLPRGIDGSAYRLVDLDGEGLNGILTDLDGAWAYRRNLSPANQVVQSDGTPAVRARFGPLEIVPTQPSRSNLAGQQLMDLDGSGQLDLVQLSNPVSGFFERTGDQSWAPFVPFASLPVLDWSEPNLRFADLTGDGLADILVIDDGVFTFYASLGTGGFDRALFARTAWDEERGPRVVFTDRTQAIYLADMAGDGLSDLVRVRNGDVCYWPNLGYGRFGAKITMDRAPRFDDDEQFDSRRVRLADIDGTGTSDLVYMGARSVKVWFNQSGNAWSAPTSLDMLPGADGITDVEVTDLLGTGTACLVWSSPLPADTNQPLRYVDLMGGQKPHLLMRMRNNLGAETRLSYAPSTRFYVADSVAGHPWVTRLPHVVHVVERLEAIDWVGRNRSVTRYAYHHGYFDGKEREFRGFGMVESWDTEEYREDLTFADSATLNWDKASLNPPIHRKTWFHTGSFEPELSVTRQYAHEYWNADGAAAAPPDTALPAGLTADEAREAYRSLKGEVLRTEVFADDGTPLATNPYTVTEHNFVIYRLQPIGQNRQAVFQARPREAVTYHYERNPADPRITHDVTLATDEWGNVLRSMSIGYPRRAGSPPPEPTLSATWQAMLAYDQSRLHVRAVEHQYTSPLTDPTAFPNVSWPVAAPVMPDTHRTPMPSSVTEAEVTGVAPQDALFSVAELDDIWSAIWDGAADIPYEAVPSSDVDGVGTLPSAPTRRILKETRILYRSDDLTVLLPAGELQSLGLPGESFRMALTPGLLTGIFDSSVADATLSEGGYVQLAGVSGWWIPSGRIYYSAAMADNPAAELATARAHFFLARRAVDPFGAVTVVAYDNFDLQPVSATDAVGNLISATHDYRVLLPREVSDPNGNRTAIAFDVLGRVIGTAVMGKTTETLGDSFAVFNGDLNDAVIAAHLNSPLLNPGEILGTASTRIIYDPHAYYRTRFDPQRSPPTVYMLARETHVADLPPGTESRYQHSFSYSDGFGREIQHKGLAEPGPLTPGGADTSPRWVGSGWTIFNNKGSPVRKYEPFFSATSAFEFAAAVGVSSVHFYDPPSREVAILHADKSLEKVAFNAWRRSSWDGNDTSMVSDPRLDPDIGIYFLRLFGYAPNAFKSWYDERIGGTFGATVDDCTAQKDAALKTAAHASTPMVEHLDALGRTCLAIEDNGNGGRYPSRLALDTEGKPLVVFDARGRRVAENCRRVGQAGARNYLAGTDIAGNVLYQCGIDDGARRILSNIAGQPIRRWDARQQAFRFRYDLLLRLTHVYVAMDGSGEVLRERLIYGEGQNASNVRGRLFRQYDTAGLMITDQYDFKGNLLSASRWLAGDYHGSPDWTALDGLTDPSALEAASSAQLSVADRFDSTYWYDAINRNVQTVTPHSQSMRPNVVRPSYNEANLLAQVDVWLQQSGTPAGPLDPITADLHAVAGITYNAHGQRMSVSLGNGTVTLSEYDPNTFRLTHLITTRPASIPANQQVVQDLFYYYDPIGNITRIRDVADTQNVIFFNNQRVEPSNDYTYDATYRLAAATGREQLGQTGGVLGMPKQVTSDDSLRLMLPQPSDGQAMANYQEIYEYDAVGNITIVRHIAGAGSWTRRYAYDEPSQIDAGEASNRLTSSSLPGDPDGGPFGATYGHDSHGNMLRMPNLPSMTWDAEDRLVSTSRQTVNTGVPETTFCTYELSGQRIVKATDAASASSQIGLAKASRVYLGPVEFYRKFLGDGRTVALQRETLHVDAGSETICLVETRTVGTDSAPLQLTRYQHTNHLGSAVLELDDRAQIISYEEYFPYGSTSYQAVRNQTESPKRYRYTEKERDEENDLYYHGARYYCPWLGRWTGPDPAGMNEGPNRYVAMRNNPAKLTDRTGADTTPPPKPPPNIPVVTGTYSQVGGHHTAMSASFTAGPGAPDPFRNITTTISQAEGGFTPAMHEDVSRAQLYLNRAQYGAPHTDPIGQGQLRISVQGEGTLAPTETPWSVETKASFSLQAGGFPAEQAAQLASDAVDERLTLGSVPIRVPNQPRGAVPAGQPISIEPPPALTAIEEAAPNAFVCSAGNLAANMTRTVVPGVAEAEVGLATGAMYAHAAGYTTLGTALETGAATVPIVGGGLVAGAVVGNLAEAGVTSLGGTPVEAEGAGALASMAAGAGVGALIGAPIAGIGALPGALIGGAAGLGGYYLSKLF